MHPCPWEEKIDPFSWNYDNLLSLQISFLSKFHKLLLAKTMGMKLKMHLQIVRSKMADTGQVSSPLVKNLPLPHQEEDIYEDIQWEWATTTNDWCSLYRMTEEVAMEVKGWNECLFPMCINCKPVWFDQLIFFPIYPLPKWKRTLILEETEIGISNCCIIDGKKEKKRRGSFFWRGVGGCGKGRVCMLNILNS